MDTQIGELPLAPADPNNPAPAESSHGTSALAAAFEFLRRYCLQFLAISAAVTLPCVWQPRIQAGDLASHVYNAWLAQLIERGQAPGLWIARQWNNIVFDVLLVRLASIVGLNAAQKILVPAFVLVFFWGAFALVCSMAKSAGSEELPWFVLPCLAMFAYGFTFQMGFMNYYLSIGLAFFALALLHGGHGWERILAVAFIPVIWLAHPLGLVLLLAAGTYMALAGRQTPRRQIFLFAGAALVIVMARLYIVGHYDVSWGAKTRIVKDGTDQLLLYGPHYLWVTRLLEAAAFCFLVLNILSRRKIPRWWSPYCLPLQLYALAVLAAVLLPTNIRLPQFEAPLGFLVERLTSVSAIFLCCVLGLMRPRKWHLAGFAALAAVFFFFLFRDTAKLNRMEDQVERYVRLLPPGQRVLATIWRFPGCRVYLHHIVDRACIGQCYSYENYEPSSEQFRVRANPGNSFALGVEDAAMAQAGEYVVQPGDVPVFQIYQCNLNMTELCMRELAVGEANGSIGVHSTP